MAKMKITKGLTPDEFSKFAGDTYDGQAHWGGTGPKGKTCRQCRHFETEGAYRKSDHNLASATCAKNTSLTAAAFPHQARACKHFNEDPDPYQAVEPVKEGGK